MWIHTNCYCRLCAGRNIPEKSPVSPLSPSLHNRVNIDSPPSPLSPALSFTAALNLPSPICPLLNATEDWPLSPVSPFALDHWSPKSACSTVPPSPTLSIAELTPGDFPSPATPLKTAYIWNLCIIPSIPADYSVFAPHWRSDASCPFNSLAVIINDEPVSPTTLSNGKKAIRSSAAPPLPPRPIPRRPKRSPLRTSKFSWSSTPTTSPSLVSPNSFHFTGRIYTFEPVAEEVKSRAGSLSLASSDSLPGNKPWWENIPEVSPLPSPVLSVHSFSGFSGIHVPEFSFPCPSPSYSPSVSSTSTSSSFSRPSGADIRDVFWTEITPQTAAEYLAIFGTSVFEDPFAWIRYPVPGPHDLCASDDDDEDDDETAHYDWDNRNPTASDASDTFGEVDDVLAFYEHSFVSSYLSCDDDASYMSFDADEYSGVTDSADVAMSQEILCASYISSFLGGSAVSEVKEVCFEDDCMASLELIISSIF
ncbi:unnamed protein product [Aureobasidium uvarum]|uniref:Uncharacterized protein n=1 Tax=Aureobasidium uvarum TaxID=2773716 RepID=A0A9N8KHG2_9PEZI|nr:unnamed protein product [Aureobasidium uvarum]